MHVFDKYVHVYCSKSSVHVFEEYVYLDFFQYKLQAKLIEEALATPGVEPTRSRYLLHVNTWCFIYCAYGPIIPLAISNL